MDSLTRGYALTALNAIKLSARQVAATFIPSAAFEQLTTSDNAVLSGPRGSGKTTLLKMLQSEALETWANDDAEKTRDVVRSVGVFVGTDRTWSEQLVFADGRVSDQDRVRIAWAAFGSHSFKSMVDAMSRRLLDPNAAIGPGEHLRLRITEAQERLAAEHAAELLRFDSRPSSLRQLGMMLSSRLVDLGTYRQALRTGVSISLPSWIDVDVLTGLDAVAEAFNDACNEPDRKWAMLFDELELAPESLVAELLGALRGHQPRLLFKLSLAPANNTLTTLDGPNAPVPGQDYEHITLTNARKTATLGFAKELVRETINLRTASDCPPTELLLGRGFLDSADEFTDSGTDEIYDDRSRRNDPYAIDSPLWRSMVALAARDNTFSEYLDRNKVDLTTLDRLSPSRRASKLRKIRNLVVVREYYRNEQGRRRSRKSFALYAGADNLLSLPDGNPRVLIVLARQLAQSVSGTGLNARVSTRHQGAAIEATLNRFLPLLEAQEAVLIRGRRISLMQFLDHTGAALAKRLVEWRFNDNLRLTFHVDTNLEAGVEELVRQGVNTGALVYVPTQKGDDRLHGSFVGKKFRLSHLLATRYGLPIHLTQSAPLSDLLPAYLRAVMSRPSGPNPDDAQAPLPRDKGGHL